jgi:hypothetical protein
MPASTAASTGPGRQQVDQFTAVPAVAGRRFGQGMQRAHQSLVVGQRAAQRLLQLFAQGLHAMQDALRSSLLIDDHRAISSICRAQPVHCRCGSSVHTPMQGLATTRAVSSIVCTRQQ